MLSYKQKGAVIDHTAASDLSSGDVVVCGVEIRVAVADIDSGAVGAVRRAGVCTLAKASGLSWSDGAQLYWDASSECLTTVSSGNTKAGIAVGDAASADTTADVVVNGNAG